MIIIRLLQTVSAVTTIFWFYFSVISNFSCSKCSSRIPVSHAVSSWKRVNVASYVTHQSSRVSCHTVYLNASSNIVLFTSCSLHHHTSMTPFFSERVFHHLACLVGIGSFSSSAITNVGTRTCSLYEVISPYWIKWTRIPNNVVTFLLHERRRRDISLTSGFKHWLFFFFVFF